MMDVVKVRYNTHTFYQKIRTIPTTALPPPSRPSKPTSEIHASNPPHDLLLSLLHLHIA
jgi:hypothetical protein